MKLKNIWLSVIIMTVSLVNFPVVSEAVSPQYDVTGIWKTGQYDYPFFQNGSEAKSILVLNGLDFGHFYSGTYVSPTKIKGIMTRRQISNNCVTSIEITYTVTSDNTMIEDQVYLDSNCDLQKGKTVHNTLKRKDK